MPEEVRGQKERLLMKAKGTKSISSQFILRLKRRVVGAESQLTNNLLQTKGIMAHLKS